MTGLGMYRLVLLAAICLVALAGCGGSADGLGEDASRDAPDGTTIIATWLDSATGLTWQSDPGDIELAWAQAVDYCDGLQGGAGWRLPDIDELRSLIRGCPNTVSGGPCKESVQCSSAGTDCYDGEECMGCADWGGSGKGGCYWPSELNGPCEWYWSSTTESGFTTYACFAHFRMAHLSHDDKANAQTHHVICVRRAGAIEIPSAARGR